MPFRFLLLPAICCFLASCSSSSLSIPGPAATVKRSEAVATAYTYTQIAWTPQERHRVHRKDLQGMPVETPDQSLADGHGWWKTGEVAKGMPYQWGGFDTPQQFLHHLKEGKAAGDIATDAKRRLGDSAVSTQACGIDCSGFVSRCLRLPRPYSTAELPGICDRLKSCDELQPGDLLLNDRHVLLFSRWSRSNHTWGYFYEAGPNPVWRVNAAEIPVDSLQARGYAPWRYRGIRD